MIKISVNNELDFKAIETALKAVDASGSFLANFEIAEKKELTGEELVIILNSPKKLEKDMNKQQYVIKVPNTLDIEVVDIKKYYDQVVYGCSTIAPRNPLYMVELHCSSTTASAKFVITFKHFNDAPMVIERYQVV